MIELSRNYTTKCASTLGSVLTSVGGDASFLFGMGHVQWLVLPGVNHRLSLLRMLLVAGDVVPIPLPESGFS